jgi:hypothetical protein
MYPGAQEWSLISDGDLHEDIPIGNGLVLKSRGKAPLDQYAEFLSRCWVGIAFVFSAGPSYSVYDIAEFGGWTITNKWRCKDPSIRSPNILCVDDSMPRSVAEALARCCDQYEPGKTAVMAGLGHVFRSDGEEFPFASELAQSWLRTDVQS